jgi:hypothetical protein
MSDGARIAVGSFAGSAIAAAVAPFIRPLFSVPTGGVGYVTVAGYPKAWDYAVVALLIAGAFVGGVIGALTARSDARAPAGAPAPHRHSCTFSATRCRS